MRNHKRFKAAMSAAVSLSVPMSPTAGLLAQPAADAPTERLIEPGVMLQEAVPLKLRDGTTLLATVASPVHKPGERLPAIFTMSPYTISWNDYGGPAYDSDLVKAGYVLITVNDRGTQFSDGSYHWMKGNNDDGTDIVSWITHQDWSNGRVGGFGCSSGGEVLPALAKANVPGLKAVVAMGAATAIGRVPGFDDQGIFYTGGVPLNDWAWWYKLFGHYNHPKFPQGISQKEREALYASYDGNTKGKMTDSLDWLSHLPSQDVMTANNIPDSEYNRMIRMKPNDPRWKEYDFINTGEKAKIPVLHVDSWYDNIEIYGTSRMFEYLSKVSPNQYLMIGGTGHCRMGTETEHTMIGDRPIGDARFDFSSNIIKFFDHWVKNDGKGPWQMPRVQYYPLESNAWKRSESWPPKFTPWTLYLTSDGHANSVRGSGELLDRKGAGQADSFVSDPLKPVQTMGGGCCSPDAAKDQVEVEARSDVLVYTTPPLTKAREIAGYVTATLYLSTDVKDTDLTLKLVDVYPDGKAFNLGDTVQRLRYRESIDREVWMEKNRVYKVELKGLVAASRFAAGHRIRIEIAGSNFPKFERNLNTGGNNFDETVAKTAIVSIHHDRQYPSALNLPEVPVTVTSK